MKQPSHHVLELPVRLAGREIRLSIPGGEEFVRGPVGPDGRVVVDVPRRFYHLSHREPGGPWVGDETVVCNLSDGPTPLVGDLVHPPQGHHKPARTREEAERDLKAWQESRT